MTPASVSQTDFKYNSKWAIKKKKKNKLYIVAQIT